MNINENVIITNHTINNTFEVLTANNFHNDTSILNCYLALGYIPVESPDRNKIWTILEKLKEIDRKNYTQGFLRFEDLEARAALDKKLEEIIKKFEDKKRRELLNELKNKAV